MHKNIYHNSPAIMERFIAAASYITFGFVGFIWLLIAFFTKNKLKQFLNYHIFQSIFISIAYFLLCSFMGLIMNILSIVPFVNKIMMVLTFYLNAPFICGFSVIQMFVYIIIGYLVLTSLQGRFSYLPWISEIIRANIRY